MEAEQELTHNQLALQDVTVLGLIKLEVNKILNNKEHVTRKMHRLDYYINTYNHNEIIDLIFAFLREYINGKLFAHTALNWFANFVSNLLLDKSENGWMHNQNNQLKLLDLLQTIEYQLFNKGNNVLTPNADINRRNFAIVLHELLKSNITLLKPNVEELWINSINHFNNLDYRDFAAKLESLRNATNDAEQFQCEELILNNNNIYNQWWTSA